MSLFWGRGRVSRRVGLFREGDARRIRRRFGSPGKRSQFGTARKGKANHRTEGFRASASQDSLVFWKFVEGRARKQDLSPILCGSRCFWNRLPVSTILCRPRD